MMMIFNTLNNRRKTEMKKQRGSLGVGTAVALGVLALVLVFGVSVIGAVISFNNGAVRIENGVKAQYEQNKNNYDNYFKKLKEVSQVPAMYVDDMRKVWDGVMTGRYGQGGSKAMFQWIKEHNPTVDSSLYKKIQDVVE